MFECLWWCGVALLCSCVPDFSTSRSVNTCSGVVLFMISLQHSNFAFPLSEFPWVRLWILQVFPPSLQRRPSLASSTHYNRPPWEGALLVHLAAGCRVLLSQWIQYSLVLAGRVTVAVVLRLTFCFTTRTLACTVHASL